MKRIALLLLLSTVGAAPAAADVSKDSSAPSKVESIQSQRFGDSKDTPSLAKRSSATTPRFIPKNK